MLKIHILIQDPASGIAVKVVEYKAKLAVVEGGKLRVAGMSAQDRIEVFGVALVHIAHVVVRVDIKVGPVVAGVEVIHIREHIGHRREREIHLIAVRSQVDAVPLAEEEVDRLRRL